MRDADGSMTQFLVGLDGSTAAAAALRWAADVAEPNGARILAVHVVSSTADVGGHPTTQFGANQGARRLAERWLLEAEPVATANIQLEVRDGDPRQVLCAVSSSVEPDLVVLGRGGDRLGVGPEHLGRVAGYTARHNPWPLAVVPVGGRHHPPRVVVGVDGSAGAGAAVDWCARYLTDVAAHVIAVDVGEAGAGSDPWSGDADGRARTDAEIERWTKPLTDAGIGVDHVPLLHQYPSDAILHLADARHADVIVVGTRGRGGFDGLEVGGTALKLLRRARIPLVLVPPRHDRTTSD